MKCKDCGNTHPASPGFPNHVLCDYYHLHMSNLSDASRCEHFKAKVLTNADRIRAMTDEELAEWIAGRYPDCPPGVSPAPIGCDDVCAGCWLEWLRQETDNG